jgi:hypothetical protein
MSRLLIRNGLTLVLLAGAFFACAFAPSEGKPNFNGQWQMDAAKSDFGKFPVPTTIIRNIVQQDPDLTIDTTQRASNGEQTARVHYRTDGGETTNRLASGPATSHAFWDGQTLVIRTTMKGKGDIDVLMEERWDLSPDGKTLTTTSHIETSKGSTDLKLVCEKIK